jgi:hypothetical protein
MSDIRDGKYGKGSWQCGLTLGVFLMFLSVGVGGLSPTPAGAEPDLRSELETLKAQLARDRMQMEQDRQRIEQLERQVGSVEAKSEQKGKELEEKITKQTRSQPRMPRHFACSCDPLTKADERIFTNNRGVGEAAKYCYNQTATLAKSTPQAADSRF